MNTATISFEEARMRVSDLLMESALLQENHEKQKVLNAEIETLLQFVLDTWSDETRAVAFVVCSAKEGSELEERAIHTLVKLNPDKPFPGLT